MLEYRRMCINVAAFALSSFTAGDGYMRRPTSVHHLPATDISVEPPEKNKQSIFFLGRGVLPN